MGATIDHLSADHRVEVLQDFQDARGTKHRAGEHAIIRRMDLDWPKQEFLIEWERDGAKEMLYFSLKATTGPRNGKMRQYFAIGEYAPIPREKPMKRRRGQPVEVPELVEGPVTDVTRYEEALNRVWALAAKRHFDEADEQCNLITASPDPYSGRLERLAGDMVAIAMTHAAEIDPVVYDWARKKAVHLWYAWGSGATSGGEGAVRAESIRAAEDALARCEAERVECGFSA
jgi:hypothetical protein